MSCFDCRRRCSKYYIKGKEAGRLEKFIENLPGIPDNIHYDGEGLYWIAFASVKKSCSRDSAVKWVSITSILSCWQFSGLMQEFTRQMDLMFRHPFIRKFAGILYKYMGLTRLMKNAGVMAVDLEGKPVAHYQDPGLPMISSGIKIGDNLYCGSLFNSYILRLDLNKHPALKTMWARRIQGTYWNSIRLRDF